ARLVARASSPDIFNSRCCDSSLLSSIYTSHPASPPIVYLGLTSQRGRLSRLLYRSCNMMFSPVRRQTFLYGLLGSLSLNFSANCDSYQLFLRGISERSRDTTDKLV